MVLANDVAELIENDPELRDALRPGTYAVSMSARHSYESAGPRYKRYGPETSGEAHDLPYGDE